MQQPLPIFCQRCGESLPKSAAFCPACGWAAAAEACSEEHKLLTADRLPTLRPELFSRPAPMDAVKFVEFNIACEAEGNAIAVGLGAAETEDCQCGCHTFVTPIIRAWWFSKN